MPDSPASALATALLGRLVERGVEHVVLAPGSRSQALALAAARLEREERVRLHVRIDERSAGFLALGLAAETGAPVPVIVTSGTAVANLHPAMLEAWHSGLPLIALTADRPEELRGVGANQTTRQAGVFGPAAVLAIDEPAPEGEDAATRGAELADLAVGAGGPVQLNLAFREPLSGSAPDAAAAPRPAPPVPAEPEARRIPIADRAVVLAGAGAGPEAEAFARAAGLPLLAEVVSGARFGPFSVPAYARLLDDPAFGGAVEQAIVFGRPTLTRQAPALVARLGPAAVVVRTRGAEVFDPAHSATVVGALALPESPGPSDWLRAWVAAGRDVPSADVPYAGDPDRVAPVELGRLARAEMAAVREPVTRRFLVEAVWRATWPHDRLVLGASRLIREADRVVPGKRIRVHANRGLAGIDGTVSTAIGIAAGAADDPRGVAGTVRVLLGDLALLHDAGGLLVPPGEPRPRVQLIVGNDGGGTIFDGLEVAGSADAAEFDRVLYTPHEVELAALAAAYGWEHARVTTRGELDRVLTAPAPGPSLVEVPLPR